MATSYLDVEVNAIIPRIAAPISIAVFALMRIRIGQSKDKRKDYKRTYQKRKSLTSRIETLPVIRAYSLNHPLYSYKMSLPSESRKESNTVRFLAEACATFNEELRQYLAGRIDTAPILPPLGYSKWVAENPEAFPYPITQEHLSIRDNIIKSKNTHVVRSRQQECSITPFRQRGSASSRGRGHRLARSVSRTPLEIDPGVWAVDRLGNIAEKVLSAFEGQRGRYSPYNRDYKP